ncbi:MAG TPA: tail fiber domain-containing protein [Mycobacterium sp.]|jgi:hypothetical protein
MPDNSSPGWYFSQVPSTNQWNASYAVKVDATNGYAANLLVDGLLLDHDPLGPMEAVTRQYVDSHGGGGAGGAGVTIGDLPPVSPSIGQLWFDGVGSQLYLYYDDPDSSQWIPVVNQSSNLASGGYLQLAGGSMTGALVLAADPTTALEAATKHYVDTSASAGIPEAPTDGQNYTRRGSDASWQVAGTGVTSWNNRTGAVTLLLTDVTGVGGAPITSPNFAGTPSAPTPTAGDSTTKLATTAFVATAIGSMAPVVTQWNGRTGAVTLQLTDVTSVGGAPLASPTFTGTPAGPTPTAGDSSTRLATTSFVTGAITAIPAPPAASSTVPLMNGAAAVGVGTAWARGDHVHPTDTTRAPLASPAFTGSPTAQTLTLSAASGNTNLYLYNAGRNWAVIAATDGTFYPAFDVTGGAARLYITPAGAGVFTGALSCAGFTATGSIVLNGFTEVNNNVQIDGQGVRYNQWGANLHAQYWNGSTLTAVVDGTYVGNYQFTSCDVRLKENVTPALDGALASLMQMPIYAYDRINPVNGDATPIDYGMIADELIGLADDCVTVPDDPAMWKGIDLLSLTARTVKGVQELTTANATLRERTEALEARLAAWDAWLRQQTG